MSQATAANPVPVPGLDPFVLDLREFHREGLEKIRKKHMSGIGGFQIVEETTGLMDQVVVRAWRHALTEVSRVSGADFSRKPPKVALIATGGYGRAQLHPKSDVDILFLHRSNLTDPETEIIKKALQTLWDTGLEIGHAARTWSDCVRLAADDLDTRTSLMENRYLAGDNALFERFHRRYRNTLSRSGIQGFIRQKEAEKHHRYRRYGATVSLQEPDLKQSAGGLRDLHHGIWLGLAAHDIPTLAGLRRIGLLREPFYGQLFRAVDFLFRIRNELHLNLGSASNKLTFDTQEAIAKAFSYSDEGGNLAEERLMRDYYSHAARIQQFADTMTNRCLRPNAAKRAIAALRRKNLGDGFFLKGGQLTVDHPETFFLNRPDRIIQLFGIQQRIGCATHSDLHAELTQTLSTMTHEDFSSSSEFQRTLTLLLSKPGRVGPLFRAFYGTAFLDLLIPEFKVIRNLPRRDLYHRYTVDEHSLITVEILDALADHHEPEKPALPLQELEIRFPAARRYWRWWGVTPIRNKMEEETTEEDRSPPKEAEPDDAMTLPIHSRNGARIIEGIREVFSKIQKPHLLYLATFLHDIGKGRGGDHHIKGGRIACEVCRRFGYSQSDTDLVIFLIEKHLELAKIAFRFDIQDFGTVQTFGNWCNTLEKLDYLYLLTLADIWAVNPDLLTEWKLSMLHSFYGQVRSFLEDRHKTELQRVERQREKYLAFLASLPRDITEREAERHLGKMPSRYAEQNRAEQLHFHLRLLRKYTGEHPVIDCRQSMVNVMEVVTIQPSRIGNFMRVTRALSSLALSISEARIYIRDDSLALITLAVAHHEGLSIREEMTERVVERVTRSLEEEWDENWNPTPLKPPDQGRSRFSPFVEVYNKVSPQYTVVEVRCADDVGVLEKITSVLMKYGLDIHVARIHTEEQRVFDTFYVLDQSRQKFEEAQKINWLKATMAKTLAPVES